MTEGTGTDGGWGDSRTPDVVAGAGTVGLAVLAPTVAWLSSARFRDWVGERLPGARRRRENGLRKLARSARAAVGAR